MCSLLLLFLIPYYDLYNSYYNQYFREERLCGALGRVIIKHTLSMTALTIALSQIIVEFFF